MTNSNESLRRERPERLQALWRFAVAITVLNVLGHSVLGFEQSWAQPLVALATTYSVELILEALSAWAERRKPHYEGGLGSFVDFLLPAHITGLAVAMLLYANERLWPIAFAAARGDRFQGPDPCPDRPWRPALPQPIERWDRDHAALVSVGRNRPALPIHRELERRRRLAPAGGHHRVGDVLEHAIHAQDAVDPGMAGRLSASGRPEESDSRDSVGGLDLAGNRDGLLAIHVLHGDGSGHDPSLAASISSLFGAAVAATYGLLMLSHVVFGLFFSLLLVCSLRGLRLALLAALRSSGIARADWPMPARSGRSRPRLYWKLPNDVSINCAGRPCLRVSRCPLTGRALGERARRASGVSRAATGADPCRGLLVGRPRRR